MTQEGGYQRLQIPEGRRVLSTEEACGLLAEPGTVHHLAGVSGCGLARLALEILSRGKLVITCATDEEVEAVVNDLSFLGALAMPGELADKAGAPFMSEPPAGFRACGTAPRVLRLSAPQGVPYSASVAERRAEQERTATLTRLALGQWDILVTNANAWVIKLPPPEVLKAAEQQLEVDTELDLERFCADLDSAGYLRVPVVEDPGTFALRGGTLDVWASGAEAPVRAELFGDLVLELKRFDATTQRSSAAVVRESLAPARSVVLSSEFQRRAQRSLRELCDHFNLPSAKTRKLIEDLCSGRNAFGAMAYAPAFYPLVGLADYIGPDTAWLVSGADAVVQAVRTQVSEIAEAAERLALEGTPHFPCLELSGSEEEIARSWEARPTLVVAGTVVLGVAGTEALDRLTSSLEEPPTLAQWDHGDLRAAVKEARQSAGKRAALDPLAERLELWAEQGFSVHAVARTGTQARRLASLLRHRGVELTLAPSVHAAPSDDSTDEEESDAAGEIQANSDGLSGDLSKGIAALQPWLTIHSGPLAQGVLSPAEGVVWLTEEEIFGHRGHHQSASSRSRRRRAGLQDLAALVPGDLVVHEEHGVGRYVGLQTRPGPGQSQLELLVVEYTGGKLFLPVYRLNQIEKFTGGERPRLDRLGGQSFARAKAKAKKKAREMADELLRLYAERRSANKDPIPPPDDEYAAFEAAFPYEETSDQAAAIMDVGQDLMKDRVMDRLVCGDVGFGKTEVAIRAAFRVASAGRQVAVLCPTTVLAQQHYLTFCKRLADYPFEVRVLSRFQSPKQVSNTLEDLKKGTVDVVVGTHRLLSKDLQFARLGLLVVDEEQRFGVVHKERIKQMRTHVDVLTLTATPIPRTMHQALGGLREMSIMSTPPVDRRAIRTIVARVDDNVIKSAIERELSRGGQVFYVYNRVEGLYERAAKLQSLLPQARIAVGHGQLKEATLERTMLDFIEGEFDVLAATSIIESGLDIPRANTMIVDRADLFGLAQLYQLRGRVGRSTERAYCYLLVPPPEALTDDARSRVEALERYTELGSGFQIASLDMELRGAGDLLGAEQTGTATSVGLELFCRMLEEASAELRGEEVVHDIEPDISFDVEALIPESYIPEVGVRLSLYKRLASAGSESEVAHLGAEMEDRFGQAPQAVADLVELMRLKAELRRLKVLVCEGTSTAVSLRFRDDTPLSPGALVELVAQKGGDYRLAPDGRLTRRPTVKETGLTSIQLADRMLAELQHLT